MNALQRTQTRSEDRGSGAGSTAGAARCRSSIYGALALAFAPPASDGAAEASHECVSLLVDLLEACGASAPAADALRLVGRAPSSRMHQRLFGHTAAGTSSPYETQYGCDTLFQQPRDLADIGAFLAGFGLALDSQRRERADHVSCECELMGFLAAKEAYALDHGDEDMLATTRDAQCSFLRDHLGRFAPAFGERVCRADPNGFYGGMGRLLRRFVEWECTRLAVEAGSPALELRKPAAEDMAPTACGSPGGCTGERCP